MATDFNKPVVTDAYATLLPGLVTANKDLAMMLEPTLTGTSTNLPTGAVRWNATTVRWECYNGLSWAPLAATYAISISGNALTATTATHLAAGVAGSLPYQSGEGATGFSSPGAAGQVLVSGGTGAPTWTASPTFTAPVLGTPASGNLVNCQIFPSGTRMPFAQVSAPTGWTQDTSDNAANRMLRVVNTAGNGVGGSHSPVLNNVVPSHTHGFSTGNVSADHGHGIGDPSHSHSVNLPGYPGGTAPNLDSNGGSYGRVYGTSAATTGIWIGGMSSNHTHSGSTDNGSSQTNWTPRYIDMIICTKN